MSRSAALEILRSVRQGAPFDVALNKYTAKLEPPDRRLAHEIASGVLRRRLNLDLQVAPLIARGWDSLDDDVRDLIRIGAYQIQFLDRVPRYAVVSETVEAAKRCGARAATGLVNAVLKRVPDRYQPAPPTGDVATDLAQRYSHPRWLVRRWMESFGSLQVEALLEHNNRPAETILRPVGVDATELLGRLHATGVHARLGKDGEIRVEGARIPELAGYDEGLFTVQDPAQTKAVEWCDIGPDEKVWDACAAPGGKASLLAETTDVIATDHTMGRVELLRRGLQRLRQTVAVAVADAAAPPFPPGSFDAVLLDAPCSATGTVRRHPDARWRLSPDRIQRAVETQALLLERVAYVVRPGGILAYVTCSIEPEENGDQVDGFLARNSDFERTKPDLSIFPWETGSDGVYAARMKHNE